LPAFFRNGIGYHKREDIEAAFKTGCCLHNMILLFDGMADSHDKEWENVDWSELDPDGEEDGDANESDDAGDESYRNDRSNGTDVELPIC
jgi:hypothetical protein